MLKKEKTPEEKEQHQAQIKERRMFKSLATKVKKSCHEIGLRAVELQLDFLQKNETLLPNTRLTKERNIAALEQGIEKYKESYAAAT